MNKLKVTNSGKQKPLVVVELVLHLMRILLDLYEDVYDWECESYSNVAKA